MLSVLTKEQMEALPFKRLVAYYKKVKWGAYASDITEKEKANWAEIAKMAGSIIKTRRKSEKPEEPKGKRNGRKNKKR